MRNVNGSVESKRYIIESTGSGVAIVDYDRDGWPRYLYINQRVSIAWRQADSSSPLTTSFITITTEPSPT